MSKARCLSFIVSIMSVLIITVSLEIDAQPTVDDEASCQTSTLNLALNLIREDLKDVKQLKEDLAEVKNLLGSRQEQSCSGVAFDSQSLCEHRTFTLFMYVFVSTGALKMQDVKMQDMKLTDQFTGICKA